MLNTTSITKVNRTSDVITENNQHYNLLGKDDISQYNNENPDIDTFNTNTNLIPNNNPNANTNTNLIPNNNPNANHRSINMMNKISDNTIILEYNHVSERFLFYDSNKSFLGSFTCNELIKYIVSKAVPHFMQSTNSTSSTEIIEKFICIIDPNTSEINIIDHLTSPFTGNIEMLIKLYKHIEKFEKEELANELLMLDANNKNKANNLFTNLVYTLLNHILKIITILSDVMKSNRTLTGNDKLVIDKFTKYSVAIVYKISSILKDRTDNKIKYIDELLEKKNKINNIRDSLEDRVLVLEQNVIRQNELIDNLSNNRQYGGDNYSSQSMSDNQESSISNTNSTDNYSTQSTDDNQESSVLNSSIYTTNIDNKMNDTNDFNYLTSINTTQSLERVIDI